MFYFPPIVDPARDVLNSHVRHFSRLVGWATVAVALGVALEGIEIVHDGIAWVKRRRREKREHADLKEVAHIFPCGEPRGETESHSNNHPRWVKRWLRVGLITVVIGVVAEWRCGAKLEHAHNDIHEYDLAKLTEADQKAGEAAKSAKTAHDEADAVKLEGDAIQERLDAASAKLSAIEEQVRIQGPRGKLLERDKATFINALRRLAPQRIMVVNCKLPGATEADEADALTRDLIDFLGNDEGKNDGAGWVAEPGNATWDECRTATEHSGTEDSELYLGGITIAFSPFPSDVVNGAATELWVELNKLKIDTRIVRGGRVDDAGTVFEKGSPWKSVSEDPTTIVLFVGPKPPFSLTNVNKRPKQP